MANGPPLAGGVGGYHHHGIGEEVVWRPLCRMRTPQATASLPL